MTPLLLILTIKFSIRVSPKMTIIVQTISMYHELQTPPNTKKITASAGPKANRTWYVNMITNITG